MRRRTHTSTRVLPDGTPLQNRLLAALPTLDYDRIAQHLRVQTVNGDMLHERGRRMTDVYFPNGGLQETGLISSRYGRMRVLRRRQLEAASCECYGVIRDHFERLGL